MELEAAGAGPDLRAALIPAHARTPFNYFERHAAGSAAPPHDAEAPPPTPPPTPFAELPAGQDDGDILARALHAGAIVPADAVRLTMAIAERMEWPH